MNWPRTRVLCLSDTHPPVTATELASQLELELLLGHRKAFVRRLENALAAAYELGEREYRKQAQ